MSLLQTRVPNTMNPCRLCDYPIHGDGTGEHYMIHFIKHHSGLLDQIKHYKDLEEYIQTWFIEQDE